MKAICIIAHPDDCIIYARPLIEATPSIEWTIMYMTHKKDNLRGIEVAKYWKDKHLIFLEHNDDYSDHVLGRTKIPTKVVKKQIQNIIHNYDILLTHGPDGEYGHIHHKLVNTITNDLDIFKVVFSNSPNLTVEAKPLDLDLLPLHRWAIEHHYDDFGSHGKYYIKVDSSHNHHEALIDAITR